MKVKPLWIIVALLYAVQTILEYNLQYTLNSENIVISIIDLVSGIFTFFVFGILLALLMALVPYKKMPFADKFRITLPMAIALVMVVMICFTGYRVYLKKVKGIELRPLAKLQLQTAQPRKLSGLRG